MEAMGEVESKLAQLQAEKEAMAEENRRLRAAAQSGRGSAPRWP